MRWSLLELLKRLVESFQVNKPTSESSAKHTRPSHPADPCPTSSNEQLSAYLQAIKTEHARRDSLVDNFPPFLEEECDGKIVTKLITRHLAYYFTKFVVIKRQPHPSELGTDIYGNPAVNPYIADRLRNEAAALRFVKSHTDIPVPSVLGLSEEAGLVCLKTRLIENGVELRNIPESHLDAAVAAVTAELENDILPQLRKLTRTGRIGSSDLALACVPPRRYWDWKGKKVFPSLVGSEDEEYVFCHTDLDRQNILVDPTSFKIVSIIDWEGAGFFPASWELSLWKAKTQEEKIILLDAAKEIEADFFGDQEMSETSSIDSESSTKSASSDCELKTVTSQTSC